MTNEKPPYVMEALFGELVAHGQHGRWILRYNDRYGSLAISVKNYSCLSPLPISLTGESNKTDIILFIMPLWQENVHQYNAILFMHTNILCIWTPTTILAQSEYDVADILFHLRCPRGGQYNPLCNHRRQCTFVYCRMYSVYLPPSLFGCYQNP